MWSAVDQSADEPAPRSALDFFYQYDGMLMGYMTSMLPVWKQGARRRQHEAEVDEFLSDSGLLQGTIRYCHDDNTVYQGHVAYNQNKAGGYTLRDENRNAAIRLPDAASRRYPPGIERNWLQKWRERTFPVRCDSSRRGLLGDRRHAGSACAIL